MPRVRCRVCNGNGVVGYNDKTCPECKGKGYVYEPQWEIDKEKEQSRDRKEDGKYILLRERKPKLKYEAPPLRFGLVLVAGAVLLVAILFRLGGVTWEEWPPLKWLTLVPIVVLLLAFLPAIIAWARKKSEHR